MDNPILQLGKARYVYDLSRGWASVFRLDDGHYIVSVPRDRKPVSSTDFPVPIADVIAVEGAFRGSPGDRWQSLRFIVGSADLRPATQVDMPASDDRTAEYPCLEEVKGNVQIDSGRLIPSLRIVDGSLRCKKGFSGRMDPRLNVGVVGIGSDLVLETTEIIAPDTMFVGCRIYVEYESQERHRRFRVMPKLFASNALCKLGNETAIALARHHLLMQSAQTDALNRLSDDHFDNGGSCFTGGLSL